MVNIPEEIIKEVKKGKTERIRNLFTATLNVVIADIQEGKV